MVVYRFIENVIGNHENVIQKSLKSFWLQGLLLAPPTGLEPVARGLTVRCSTDWAKEEYEILMALNKEERYKRCPLLPIFPDSRPSSIVGTMQLNFCVRYGNRWTLHVNETNSFVSLYCVRIYLSSRTVARQVLSAPRSLTSVFGMGTGGPCALMTRTMVHLQGFEPGTHWLRVSCSTNWAKGAFGLPGRGSSLKTKKKEWGDTTISGWTYAVQALGLLVSVSWTHYCAYTSDLSNL